MPRIPTLATDRLVLRPPSPGDLADFVALGADAEVMRYLGGQTHAPAQAARWLDQMLIDARHGFADADAPDGLPGWLVAIERETGAFVGLALLTMMPATHVAAIGAEICRTPRVEVGYRLARSFWGRGYATEAGAALVRYAFERLNVPHVYAFADVRNAASNRVLEKLGLTLRTTYEFGGQSIHFRAIERDAGRQTVS